MPTNYYKNYLSKKIYEYKAVHDLKFVDNIADKLISGGCTTNCVKYVKRLETIYYGHTRRI